MYRKFMKRIYSRSDHIKGRIVAFKCRSNFYTLNEIDLWFLKEILEINSRPMYAFLSVCLCPVYPCIFVRKIQTALVWSLDEPN